MNIGFNPTISKNNQPTLEAYILGIFNKEKYGSTVQIIPIEFFREEKKFSSLEDLKSQIAVDCELANNLFNLIQK